MGPRIAARRATIDAALSAANHRTRLVHALDSAIDRVRDRDGTVTAVQGAGRPVAHSNPPALCNTRGGSFQDGPFELNCSSANTAKRLTASISIGIRCCADSN